jgi:Protein of unknown function (DUF4240)
MGFFNKLFGKGNSSRNVPNLTKTGQMLDENLYWKIIEESLKKSTDQDNREEYLISRIQKLTPAEIIGFHLRTQKLLCDIYTSDIWCAAYIMNGGCSDDGFEYFRYWVISNGKETYYKTKENPDSLINKIDEEIEGYEFESFGYVASTAFENKTEKSLFDYIDGNFKYSEEQSQKFDFTWEEEKPDTLKTICPKLFEKMWK